MPHKRQEQKEKEKAQDRSLRIFMDVVAVVMLYRTLVRIGDSSMRVHRGLCYPSLFSLLLTRTCMVLRGNVTVQVQIHDATSKQKARTKSSAETLLLMIYKW